MASEQREHLKRYLNSRKVEHKSGGEENVRSSSRLWTTSGPVSQKPAKGELQMVKENTVQLVKTSYPRTLPPISRSQTPLSSQNSVERRQGNRNSVVRIRSERRYVSMTMNSLPDELLLKIFGYLSPVDLMTCSRVSRHWSCLANDNVLWRKIVGTFVPKDKRNSGDSMSSTCPYSVPSSYWKSKCMSDAAKFNPSTALYKLKKIDPFSGLPAATHSVLEKVAMRWVASFINEDGEEMKHAFHSDQFNFSMSICVRWYGVDISSFSLSQLRRIRIFAARPVLKDQTGQTLRKSPCKRSLLRQIDFKSWTQWISSQKPVAEDEGLLLYSIGGELILGVWKSGGDIAFAAIALHKHNLVQSSLLGSNSETYVCPRPKFKHDDVDKEQGLHGYQCALELRNLRTSLWSEQFTNLFCHHEDFSAGFATFRLIDPERSYQRSSFEKRICLPWKTEAFHGKIDGVCILDGTVLDEHGNPMWCFSSPVSFRQLKVDGMYYEYDGKQAVLELNEEGCGAVSIHCIWEDSTQKYFINDARLLLSLAYINKWFGTRY